MPDYVTDKEWLNLPEEGRDIRKNYIEHTKGVWVRKNTKDNLLEIWIDGIEVAAWEDANNIEGRLTSLLREAYQHGILDGKKQIREALGIK